MSYHLNSVANLEQNFHHQMNEIFLCNKIHKDFNKIKRELLS